MKFFQREGIKERRGKWTQGGLIHAEFARLSLALIEAD